MECEEVTTQRGTMGELQPQTRLLLIARFLVKLVKMGSHCVARAVLELALSARSALRSQRATCLCS